MAWHIEERRMDTITDSNGGLGTKREWDIWSDDEDQSLLEAREAFIPHLPRRDAYGNKPADITYDSVDGSVDNLWRVVVTYAADRTEQLDFKKAETFWSESFSTGSNTVRVIQALGEKRLAIDNNTPIPNFRGGVGWNGEAFEGVDCVAPGYVLEIKTRVKYRDYFGVHQDFLSEARGCINNAPWMGFERHCVLFEDASSSVVFQEDGETMTDEDGSVYLVDTPYYEITLRFQILRGTTLQTDAGTLRKPGWDYCWPLWERKEDEVSGTVLKTLCAYYVNQVYREMNFNRFGL